MADPQPRRGRVHDAEGAQEAILNAAEEVFAEHGFDGARIDAIAAAADYNKSLIFHYFGDKIGLYAAVLRRADREMNSIQEQVFASMFDEETVSNASKFKALLKTVIGAFFDHLVEHPRVTRMLLWEMAENWQTYAKIISQRDFEDVNQFRAILQKVQQAGLLRTSFNPAIQLFSAIFFCQSYLGSISLYQMLLPDQDLSSSAALASAREYIIEFVVHGLVLDSSEAKA